MDSQRQLIEMLSWRLATEVVRHCSSDLHIFELHPGGGMYDVLAVYHPQHHDIIHFNRVGSIHLFARLDGTKVHETEANMTWEHALAATSPVVALNELGKRVRLPEPDCLPPTTPPVLVYRFVTEFLAHAAFGRAQWQCRSGYLDSSGMTEGVRMPFFESFPGAYERLAFRGDGDPFGQAAYRFWFLTRNDEPVLCLETTGRCWTLGGQSVDLMARYKRERRLWPLVFETLGDQLP